jgi:two-component system sensor histidine kinase/response regulator
VGIESITANDGKEAVEQYQEHRDKIDLILLDLHMPVMNGYEAAEKIRELSADVPIVAMTADVIMGVRNKCEESGIYHYISKPFNPDQLIQIIKDIILENESTIDGDTTVLDRKLGLKNMGDNLELYLQVLEEYRNENQDTLERLETAVREKRYVHAAQIVHKVKGSSGSIGAKSLYDAAILLQKALDEENEDEIIPLHQRFAKLLKKLLEELM